MPHIVWIIVTRFEHLGYPNQSLSEHTPTDVFNEYGGVSILVVVLLRRPMCIRKSGFRPDKPPTRVDSIRSESDASWVVWIRPEALQRASYSTQPNIYTLSPGSTRVAGRTDQIWSDQIPPYDEQIRSDTIRRRCDPLWPCHPTRPCSSLEAVARGEVEA